MTLANLVIGAPEWWPAAIAVLLAGLAAVAWSYRGLGPADGVRLAGIALKVLGVALLAFCLVNPLWSGTRARPGENLFLVLVDDSRGMNARDHGADESRGERLREVLARTGDDSWRTRLEQDFEVRAYAFGDDLRRIPSFDSVTFERTGSGLYAALDGLRERYADRPVAGILLFGDGNATDVPPRDFDTGKLPPIHPVTTGSGEGLVDVAIEHVAVTETSFEDAPITVRVDATTLGVPADERVVARLLDPDGELVEEATQLAGDGQEPLSFRFEVRQVEPGVRFFTARLGLAGDVDEDEPDREAAYANNERLVLVHRRRDPQRILYVAGRPNWEFKFLNRAIEEEDQLKLVGLVRIADREPKFVWRGREDESSNPLFRGFEKDDGAATERFDEAVTVRLNVEDDAELPNGRFPKDAAGLFKYDAIVLDDVERTFFTTDQLELMERFVSERGGGLLVLGGLESLADGGYARTPIENVLPVFLEGRTAGTPEGRHALELTRDGWLQPWVRLRDNEAAERTRLEDMPDFRVLNHIGKAKPAAIAMAHVRSAGGALRPALVVQRFGSGRSAVLTIGDLWRWHLQREEGTDDQQKAWRQMIRWLVADVPAPVEVSVDTDETGGAVRIRVDARDGEFGPRDDATVKVTIDPPDGDPIELAAEPSLTEPGTFATTHLPTAAGAYSVRATVTDEEGTEVGGAESGWVHAPDAREFASVAPNTELLERLAEETGGKMLAMDDLDDFAGHLAFEPAPVTEPWTYPLWHQGWVFLLAVCCFAGEWGLRRWRGLP